MSDDQALSSNRMPSGGTKKLLQNNNHDLNRTLWLHNIEYIETCYLFS